MGRVGRVGELVLGRIDFNPPLHNDWYQKWHDQSKVIQDERRDTQHRYKSRRVFYPGQH